MSAPPDLQLETLEHRDVLSMVEGSHESRACGNHTSRIEIVTLFVIASKSSRLLASGKARREELGPFGGIWAHLTLVGICTCNLRFRVAYPLRIRTPLEKQGSSRAAQAKPDSNPESRPAKEASAVHVEYTCGTL